MRLGHLQDPRWPAPEDALADARRVLGTWRERRVLVVPAPDTDGLAAGVLAVRALETMGARGAVRLPGKGEHAHSPSFVERVRDWRPEALVLLGWDLQTDSLVPGVPTLVVERHTRAAPRTDDTHVLCPGPGGDDASAVSTSLLTYALAAPLVVPGPLEWLATVGTVAALGMEARVPFLKDALRRAHRKSVTETVALVNAAARASLFPVARAQEVLLRARSARDIAQGAIPGVDALRDCRLEVRREAERCARTPPRLSSHAALLLFSSEARVHPLVARRWESRLPDHVILAANAGYLPGRVDFTVRGPSSPDVVALLDTYGAAPRAEGPPPVVGGSLSPSDFLRLTEVLGFRGLRLDDLERRGAFPG
ncbi:hypothetical protein LZ198_11550 [Myxococcus sp. K15C18031901]|uniref:hypothetical protein n=1 Tax=Myxococcus dinghuensis TaxID=2906761 RepID=UPI0020A7D368|nr:hypothetical protein [Myxococcus dinghuensis]MCP3099504.1 hypothetical protein [Myxococcus dinghuensis]